MATVALPLDKGLYKNGDKSSLKNPSFSVEQKNLLVDDTGANFDAPGRRLLATLGTSPVVGAAFWADKVVVVTRDRKIFSIDEQGNHTEIQDGLLEGSSRPTFANDGVYLAIAGGGAPKRWSGTGLTSDMPGSPPDCRWIVCLDSYWISALIADQEIRFAGPTSALRETWNSADFFSAEGLSDNIIALGVNDRDVWAFGPQSIEIFQNVGASTGVPFSRSSFIRNGLIAPDSIVQEDNTFFWLDANRRFMQAQGRTPVQISQTIDKELRGLSSASDCFGFATQIEGQYLLQWVFPAAGRSFVYNLKSQQWHECDAFVNSQSAASTVGAYCYAASWSKHIVGDSMTGAVYELTNEAKTDGNYPLRRLRRTGPIDHGTKKRKRSNFYLLDVKRGVGTSGEPEPKLLMRVNDDGKGWTDPVEIGLGFPGSETEPLQISDLSGVYVNREVEFSMTDAAELRINGVEEDVEVLS